ncbi:MAG: DUF3237 domain-containing protein [Burkholderiaceae bacterium]|nr:DUF3237 domain-containing protein [Burkholderiaceae bacterium]
MPVISTEKLFTLTLEVASPLDSLGKTPYGERRIAAVTGGHFEGPRIKGTVKPGGGDWILVRQDGVFQLDVRITLQTEDDALVYMTYRGLRHGPAEVIERLNRGERVDPASYYFRIAPQFETGAQQYEWLNRLICVGSGHRLPTGPVYEVYAVN